MTKHRLEAFSDGVFAIILTIMVLELKVPQPGDPGALARLGLQVLSYTLSFAYVAIYWNNHHHLLHAAQSVNGRILWLNTLLLFFLSFFPFCTAWLGQSHWAALPVQAYGVALLAAAYAYYFLSRSLVRLHGPQSLLARAVGSDAKGQVSLLLYALGIACSFWQPVVGYAFYVATALLWLVPDSRIEAVLTEPAPRQERRRPSPRRRP